MSSSNAKKGRPDGSFPPRASRRRPRGASSTEYAIIAGMVSMFALGAVPLSGDRISNLFDGTAIVVETDGADPTGGGRFNPGGGEADGLSLADAVVPGGARWSEPYAFAMGPVIERTGRARGADVVWSISTGGLPQGYALDPQTGEISGTSIDVGPSTFEVTAVAETNGAEVRTSKTFTITVAPVPAVSDPGTPAAGLWGSPYAWTAEDASTIGGGVGADDVFWQVSSGTLPDWAVFDVTTGEIAGVPDAVGTTDITLRAVAGPGAFEFPTSITVEPDPQLSFAAAGAAPNARVDTPWSFSAGHGLRISGGVSAADVTWSLSDAPSWMTIDPATGAVSGIPDAPGAATATVLANVGGKRASLDLSTTVFDLSITVSNASWSGTEDRSYSFTVPASLSGIPRGDLDWRVVSGSVPSGMSFSGGLLSGAPRNPGSYAFVVEASHGSGAAFRSDRATVSMHVRAADRIALSGGSFSGWRGAHFSYDLDRKLSLTGVKSHEIQWMVMSGSLPAGLSIDSSNQLRGTPSSSGSYSFTLRAFKRNNPYDWDPKDDASFSMRVSTPTIRLWTEVKFWGHIGTSHSRDFDDFVSVSGISKSQIRWSGSGCGFRLSSGGVMTGRYQAWLPYHGDKKWCTFTARASAAGVTDTVLVKISRLAN